MSQNRRTHRGELVVDGGREDGRVENGFVEDRRENVMVNDEKIPFAGNRDQVNSRSTNSLQLFWKIGFLGF